MKYKEEVIKAMEWLGKQKDTLFLGQTVLYPGSAIHATMCNTPADKKIEMPVTEEMQLGASIGLSLGGLIPVSVYPRFDFFISATNQLVNNLDKLSTISNDIKTKVIIRVGIGSTSPLYPGPQHTQDHSEAFRKLLTTVELVQLHNPEDIVPAYQKAYNRSDGISTILIEYMDFYNEK